MKKHTLYLIIKIGKHYRILEKDIDKTGKVSIRPERYYNRRQALGRKYLLLKKDERKR